MKQKSHWLDDLIQFIFLLGFFLKRYGKKHRIILETHSLIFFLLHDLLLYLLKNDEKLSKKSHRGQRLELLKTNISSFKNIMSKRVLINSKDFF